MHATLVFERKNMFQAGIAARVVNNLSTLKAESDPRKTERRSVFLVSAFVTILTSVATVLVIAFIGVQGGYSVLSYYLFLIVLPVYKVVWI